MKQFFDFKTYKIHNFISQGLGLRSETEISSNGENSFVNNMCQFFISKRLKNAFLNLLVMAVYVMKLTGTPLSNTYQLMRDFLWENVNTQPLTVWRQDSTNVQNKCMTPCSEKYMFANRLFWGGGGFCSQKKYSQPANNFQCKLIELDKYLRLEYWWESESVTKEIQIKSTLKRWS